MVDRIMKPLYIIIFLSYTVTLGISHTSGKFLRVKQIPSNLYLNSKKWLGEGKGEVKKTIMVESCNSKVINAKFSKH